jgi:hypothetical protein
VFQTIALTATGRHRNWPRIRVLRINEDPPPISLSGLIPKGPPHAHVRRWGMQLQWGYEVDLATTRRYTVRGQKFEERLHYAQIRYTTSVNLNP